MSQDFDQSREAEIRQHAAVWVLRRDRGLTAAEQDAFSAWLAADPRHGIQLRRHGAYWSRLDALAEWRPEHSVQPNPDLLAPPLRFRLRRFVPAAVTVLSAAAAVIIAFTFFDRQPANNVSTSPALAARAEIPETAHQRILEDGSIIELNRNAQIRVEFGSTQRRVWLEQGEAHFAVVSNPERPFVVTARGVDVLAVGTAFNVRVEAAAVEVLVTEGRVQLNPMLSPETSALSDPSISNLGPNFPAPTTGAMLEARQRAVISLQPDAPPPEVATLTPGEIERVLAWQHRLLDFTAQPLSAIVVEFNRRNLVQLVVVDSALASVRVSASIRSDNVEGFVRLLEAGFGARAEYRGGSEILLRTAP